MVLVITKNTNQWDIETAVGQPKYLNILEISKKIILSDVVSKLKYYIGSAGKYRFSM